MFRSLFLLLQLFLIAGLFSCRSSRPVISNSSPTLSAGDYIYRYKDLAVSEMIRTGVPASITLAQGMIESDFGRSRLAREANNHFGIKCHNGWTGPTIRHNDDRRNECFRKYPRAEESYYDHSDFLRSGSRYSFLFSLNPTDYKGWARGLKRAGYATNPDYANMLIRKIEENNLWEFDNGYQASKKPSRPANSVKENLVVPDSDIYSLPVPAIDENTRVMARVPRIMEKNRIQYIVVKDGDTRDKLEKEFNLLKWELQKYNELESDFSIFPGQILYIQPKRSKAEQGKDYHTAVEGDTMYAISQLYGLKLKSLYEMNRMEEGREPVAGEKLWLRKIKPVQLGE